MGRGEDLPGGLASGFWQLRVWCVVVWERGVGSRTSNEKLGCCELRSAPTAENWDLGGLLSV